MARRSASASRGTKRSIVLRSRHVVHSENGLRSVPLGKTLGDLEAFFLANRLEVQFQTLRRSADEAPRALLELLSPAGEEADERFFGKGTSESQALVSACMEFIERWCGRMRPEDVLFERPYEAIALEARDPFQFCLDPEGGYHPAKEIDWVWGFSLTRHEPVRVPANLVFCPYEADRRDKYIAYTDSNGLASGNNLEEAVLHGLLEVVERDAVVIGEFNSLPHPDLDVNNPPADISRIIEGLERRGIRSSFKAALTDLPIPVISAFLRHRDDPAMCAVAFGCHLDPVLALSRALTEAVQLIPLSVNQEEWIRSRSPERYEAKASVAVSFRNLDNLSSGDLKENVEICLGILAKIGSEVFVVDLSLPDIPFPVVRVLATGLQPLLHEGDMRLSPRFFQVPVRLGYGDRPANPKSVRIWPIVGYR